MTQPKPRWTWRAGCAVSRDVFYLSGTPDESGQAAGTAASRMVFYQHRAADSWLAHDRMDWRVTSICLPQPGPDRVYQAHVLGQEGQVKSYSLKGSATERIADAGKPGDGRVSRIRAIGAHLYVCGTGGQVYRRDASGWKHIGAQSPITPGHTAGQVNAAGDLADVNGADENALYAVGAHGYMAFFTGADWIEIERVTAAHLNFILPTSDNMIWVAGARGTLLKGNIALGFFSAIALKYADIDFYAIALYNRRVFMGTSDGLYELVDNRPQRLPVSDKRGLGAVRSVEVKDGVLWALGARQLVRYDGTAWETVAMPQPSRGKKSA